MVDQPTEAVIAGSRGLALALFAPLAERLGARPRVAADPSQVLQLLGGPGVVVVEFQGDRSLAAIRALLESSPGLAVVAAVPDGHASAVPALRSLGVEPARWDGRPDAVLDAVSRRLAAADAGNAEPAPAPPAPAAPEAEGAGVSGLFDDIPFDEAPLEVSAPLFAPAPAAGGAWPANVPGAVAAADALGEALAGTVPPEGTPLEVVAGVIGALTPLERAVLAGEPQAIETDPIRRAAVMRVRVAVALATAPQAPAPGATDPGAVSALLAELDGLLADVNALVAAAPAEQQPSLEQVRNGLVKEAIDFSEAAHRAVPAEAIAEARAGVTSAAERKAAQTRGVTFTSRAEEAIASAEASRRNRWLLGLGLAILVAGGFHGWRWYDVHAGMGSGERQTRAGAPADSIVSAATGPGATVLVRTPDDRPFTPDELHRMEQEEALRGNSVRPVGPAAVMIVPGGGGLAPPPPGAASAAPASAAPASAAPAASDAAPSAASPAPASAPASGR